MNSLRQLTRQMPVYLITLSLGIINLYRTSDKTFYLILSILSVQPWWLGSLALYLSHSVEEVHLEIGGSNPIQVWYQLLSLIQEKHHSHYLMFDPDQHQPKSHKAGLGKCRHLYHLLVVPIQGAILEKGGY